MKGPTQGRNHFTAPISHTMKGHTQERNHLPAQNVLWLHQYIYKIAPHNDFVQRTPPRPLNLEVSPWNMLLRQV